MVINDFQKYQVIKDSFFKIKDLKKKPVCFLDRDGILIKDKHYIKNQDQVELENGVKSFMNDLVLNKIPAVVVTNQSGISRGITTWEDYDLITKKMLQLIGLPNPIVSIFANSHLNCQEKNWRKPNPYMLTCASNLFNLDIKNSIMIGDRVSDLIAGCRANVGTLIHLKTGHGKNERNLLNYYKNGNIFSYKKKESKLFLFETFSEMSFKISPFFKDLNK